MEDIFKNLRELTHSLSIGPAGDVLYIRALEKTLEMAAESAGLGFWIWNVKSNYLFLTWDWATELGHPRNLFKNHYDTWLNLVHPDDIDDAKKLLEEHVGSNGDSPYETIIRYKNFRNEYVYMRSFGEIAVRDTESQPLFVVGLVESLPEVI